MDPDKCFLELLVHLSHNEEEEAKECRDNLVTWMDRGGFLPTALKENPSLLFAFDGGMLGFKRELEKIRKNSN